MKTNKSYAKRIQRTKNGKLVARKPGGNHFNAKESRSTQLQRKGKQAVSIKITAKAESRFIQG